MFTCVLIVYGVRASKQGWFWLAFGYKSALDACAACVILATKFSKSISGMIAFESAIGVFVFLGLAGLAFLRGRFRNLAHPGDDTCSFT